MRGGLDLVGHALRLPPIVNGPHHRRPPLYLMHGMWCTGATLARLAQPLRAAGWEVHAPTLPLHRHNLNRRERARLGRLSLRDYVAFHQREIKRRCQDRRPILIGHSMGGLLAQMIAPQVDPHAIALLAPAAPAGIQMIHRSSVLSTSFAVLKLAPWLRPHRPDGWSARYGLENCLSKSQGLALRKSLVLESGRAFCEIVGWQLSRRGTTRIDAQSIQAPMLVLAAEQDRILPPHVVEQIAARYPQAEYHQLPDCGHMFFLEPGTDAGLKRLQRWIEAVALPITQQVPPSQELVA